MQSTDVLYRQIIGDPNHWFETRLIIDGVGTFGEDEAFEVTTKHEMLTAEKLVGNATAGELDVKMFLPSTAVPTMAKVMPQIRACRIYEDEQQNSDWLAQGVFFVDTREVARNDDGLDVLTIHGYDAMLKAESPYNGRIVEDSTDAEMVEEIAYQMGVNVDPRTYALMTNEYTIPLPVGYTYREILGYIASMYAGSFTMSETGELRLVSVLELPPATNYLIDQTGAAITFGEFVPGDGTDTRIFV